MIRFTTLAAVAALTIPGLAAAQTQDCVAAGLLVVDSVSMGTQHVTRDPRSPNSQLVTVSASIRNVSAQPVSFTASFSIPPVQQNFVTGQRWVLSSGNRMTLIIANVLPPGLPDSTVRQVLRLSCG